MSASTSNNNSGNDWSAQAQLYSSQSSRITELHAADLVAVLQPEILEAKTILEIGAGTGAFAQAYLKQFPSGVPGQTLILTDLSSGMLDKARETVVVPDGYQTTIQFQEEDGSKLEGIEDNFADLVVSSFGAFLIPDQEKTLKTILRVLKPDGVFGNASWNFGGTLSKDMNALGLGPSLQDVFFIPMKTIDNVTFEQKLAEPLLWSTPERISSLLQTIDGFKKDASVYKAVHSLSMDWDLFWEVQKKNPVTKPIMEGATEGQVQDAESALVKFFQDMGQKDPLKDVLLMSAISLLTVARKSE